MWPLTFTLGKEVESLKPIFVAPSIANKLTLGYAIIGMPPQLYFKDRKSFGIFRIPEAILSKTLPFIQKIHLL